jgi:Ala-tRNA(Pro) deacylase
MEEAKRKLIHYLDSLRLEYQIHEHPPVKTVEDAMQYWKEIDAVHCKNLFLRNQKGNRHFLIVMPHDKNVSMKEIQKKLGQGKLSFASERRLQQYLHLEAGGVSPFGIINDTENHVKLFIDHALQNKTVSFHPNVNTATLTLSFADFIHFLEESEHEWEMIEL